MSYYKMREKDLRAAILKHIRRFELKPYGYHDSTEDIHYWESEAHVLGIEDIIYEFTPIYGFWRAREEYPEEAGTYLVGSARNTFKVAAYDTERGWLTVNGDRLEPEFVGWWPLPSAHQAPVPSTIRLKEYNGFIK